MEVSFETALSWAANFLQVLGALFALKTWLLVRGGKRAADEAVSVVLVTTDTEHQLARVLPLELIRRDVSRAELFGRIGALPMRTKGARFTLRALGGAEFLRSLNKVTAGRSAVIRVPCTQEELDQFEL